MEFLMINSEYPLCVDCEHHGTIETSRNDKITHICTNDNVQVIDVVTGVVHFVLCEKQRKANGMEAFGLDNPNVCGLKGQYFEQKVLDS
jgi:hypothetical protein